MKRKDTLLGLIALALVVGGMFWARGWRGDAGPEGPALHPAASPGPGTDADASLPDVTLADAAVDVGELRVTLSVVPRPPVAFEKTSVRVRVERGAAPVTVEGGRISFEMSMPMGDHRYTLVADENGWYGAQVVLPFCRSGNARWYALVEGTAGGQPFAGRFRVDLTRPGTAPGP